MSVRGKPEREASAGANRVFQAFLVHSVDVEWRIGENEVELAGRFVRVVVVAVDVPAVTDFAFQSVNCEVHPAQASGFISLLDAVNG